MTIIHENFVGSFNLKKLIWERVQMVPELLDGEAMLLLDAYKGLAQQPNEKVRQVILHGNLFLFGYLRFVLKEYQPGCEFVLFWQEFPAQLALFGVSSVVHAVFKLHDHHAID